MAENDLTRIESEVVKDEASSLKGLVQSFQEVAKPFAKTQETQAIEATKQLSIRAGLARLNQWHSFCLAIVVLGLAVAAIFMKEPALAEKLVFAVLGFMGGYGYGKSRK